MQLQSAVTTQDIIFKLSKILFSQEVEQFIQVIDKSEANNKFDLGCTMEEFRKYTSEEQDNLIEKIKQNMQNNNNESKIEFNLANERYELRIDTQINSIYLAHYKEDEHVEMKEILNQKVSKNVESFKKDLDQISEEYAVKQFYKGYNRDSKEFYNNIIASRTNQTVSAYISDQALIVFDKLKSLFNDDEKKAIEKFCETKFAKQSSGFDSELSKFFLEWTIKLKKGSYTENNKFEFNDSDNDAYYVNNKKYHMIVQKSQNTIFAYIIDCETSQIKIWNCANIESGNVEYEMNNYDTYFDLMKEIGNPYSYYSFPFELKGMTYPKSANYYMEHFNDESEFLVFDTNKGFRINTYFSDSMATDVPLLNSVVNHEYD